MKRRALWFLAGVLILVSGLTLFELGSRERHDDDGGSGLAPPQASGGGRTLPPVRERPQQATRTAESKRSQREAESPRKGASQPPPARLRRVDLAGVRARHGLPPVMTALQQARRYRAPTPAERSNPELGELYGLERKIHKLTWMARHARTESGRFLQDARAQADPKQKALLEQSAVAYQQLFGRYQDQAAELRKERGQLMNGLAHREE